MRRLIPVAVLLSLALLLGLAVAPSSVAGQDATAERSFDTDSPTPGETVNVTTTIDITESAEVNFIDEFDPEFASAKLISVTANNEEVSTLVVDAAGGSVVVLTETVDPGTLAVTYEVEVPSDAAGDEQYAFEAAIEVDGERVPVSGDSVLTVGGAAASFAVSLNAPESAVAGESLTAEYTVENTGVTEGTQDIVFSADEDQIEAASVTLAAGETTTGVFEYIPGADEGPEVELAIASDDETATSTLMLESSPDNGSADDDGSGDGDDGVGNGDDGDDGSNGGDGSGPGFGLLGAVLGTVLLTGYGIVWRRTQNS